MIQELAQIQALRPGMDPGFHAFQLHHIVFKGKSQVFCNTETNKLTICILQDRTDQMRFLINTEIKGFFPLNEELTTTGSLIDIRDNPI